jgi:REP element-mobilizing transposase RayT
MIIGIFWKLSENACDQTGWQVHACCLMQNHFHRVVETPKANLVAGMKWFLTVDWIAQRLQMGCRHTLANWLRG